MASSKQLEVQSEDRAPQKWCISLREDKFENFLSQGNPTVNKVFGDGSLFSPYLFRKFFDPSDAFPLWEFESDILLSHLRSSGQTAVDWAQTDKEYVVKAEIPGKWSQLSLSLSLITPVFLVLIMIPTMEMTKKKTNRT